VARSGASVKRPSCCAQPASGQPAQPARQHPEAVQEQGQPADDARPQLAMARRPHEQVPGLALARALGQAQRRAPGRRVEGHPDHGRARSAIEDVGGLAADARGQRQRRVGVVEAHDDRVARADLGVGQHADAQLGIAVAIAGGGGDASVVVAAPVDEREHRDRRGQEPGRREAEPASSAAVSHGPQPRPPRTC
jgi:hypothetical protein